MTLRSVDVPRNVADRQTVLSWQAVRDFAEQTNKILGTFTISLPVFPYGRELPRITGHIADANTVALWHGDPPDNGGNGLIDSSGNGLTLEAVGPAGFGELGYGREGFMCDGTTYYRRVGQANDAILNSTFLGDHTIELLVRPTNQPNGNTVFDYGAPTNGTVDHDTLANVNFQLANATGGPNTPNSCASGYFYQTGAAVGHFVQDSKVFPINQVQHIAVTQAGATLKFYVNGFLQSTTGGIVARSALVTPAQFVHIGADRNAAFIFNGFIGSVKVSNKARSVEYIYSDAAHCLGLAQFETSRLRPLMRVSEPCVLLAADIVPDDRTGVHGATDTTIVLYRLNATGSQLTQTKLAAIDGSVASAKPWSAYRAQAMRISHANVTLAEDDIIAISGAGLLPNGAINLTFGRLI